jgi:TetR/AcrR family transcriptional regulator, cholesterol catabolism regulator
MLNQKNIVMKDDYRPVLKEISRKGKTRKPMSRPKKSVERVSNSRHLKQREHILRHAAKLFADTGYAATTMDVLSEVTDMNKASLYYYFGSKRDILFEIVKIAIADGLQRAIPATRMKSARDGMTHVIECGIQTLAAHQSESRIFLQEQHYYKQIFSTAQFQELIDLQRRYMKVVYEVLQQGIDAGEFHPCNVHLTGGLLVTWITTSLRFLSTDGQDKLTEALTRLLLPALSAVPIPG